MFYTRITKLNEIFSNPSYSLLIKLIFSLSSGNSEDIDFKILLIMIIYDYIYYM